MTIGILGTGTWGYCLAYLLALKNYKTISWTRKDSFAQSLNAGHAHPHLKGHPPKPNMSFTSQLSDAVNGVDFIVESVTAQGLRSVARQIKQINSSPPPIVITSKGIEQGTGLIMPEVLLEIFGPSYQPNISCLSGPSYAEEVIKGLPTSVVVTAYENDLMMQVCDLFSTPTFRVYPNEDIKGVSYGGALKNIIAIACGIAEGLGMGFSTKAAIMTRGLHEIRKLAIAQGCQSETLSGLSGMGDLCLTCGSLISRNCRFGYLLAKGGLTPIEAQKQIGTVVEGAHTCLAALQISKQTNVLMPITEMVYKIIYEGMPIQQAVQMLMERSVKAEHL